MSFNLTRNRTSGPGFRERGFSAIIPTSTSFTDELQGYWKFDGNGLDSSGNARELTFTGITAQHPDPLEAYAAGLIDLSYSLTG